MTMTPLCVLCDSSVSPAHTTAWSSTGNLHPHTGPLVQPGVHRRLLTTSLYQSRPPAPPVPPAPGPRTWTSATCCTASGRTAVERLQGAAPTPTSPPARQQEEKRPSRRVTSDVCVHDVDAGLMDTGRHHRRTWCWFSFMFLQKEGKKKCTAT